MRTNFRLRFPFSILSSVFLWFLVCGPLLFCHVTGYNPDSVCWFTYFNRTANVSVPVLLRCPTWRPDMRVPAYCCGTDALKYCCEWSMYVINTLGAGNTGVGVGLLVGLGFLAAFVIFLLLCLLFQLLVVAGWRRSDTRDSNRLARARNSEL